MLRSKHFIKLVNEAVEEGMTRGSKLFIESLEQDLEQDQLFESTGGLENYFNNLLANGIVNDDVPINLAEGLEDISEEDIDKLVEHYGLKD